LLGFGTRDELEEPMRLAILKAESKAYWAFKIGVSFVSGIHGKQIPFYFVTGLLCRKSSG
jgi:hypothetical protein